MDCSNDYGCNIFVGRCFFANFNFTVLDEAPVTIGDGCFIDPSVSIYTACHSTDPVNRNSRREWAKPGSIGDNVWIGGSVTILPTSLPQGFPHLYARSAVRLPEPQ